MKFNLYCEDFTIDEIIEIWFDRGAVLTVNSTEMTFVVDYEK